ncbi:MAG: four helix bundle protein [bacterium]|nr:four helix bundle protein [bacterium]
MEIHSYKELIVWQKGIEGVIELYALAEQFPKSELYGLASQMKRAIVSIPSNIAEGRRRGGKKEFCQFLLIAYGSGAELETQLEIVRRLPWGRDLDFRKIDSLLLEVMRMLNKMISSLKS